MAGSGYEDRGAALCADPDAALNAAAAKPAKALLLPKMAMMDTPEVAVPPGFPKDESDEGEGDDEGPAVVNTVSARSRSGAVVVCPPGLSDNNLPSNGSILHASGNCQPCAWFWRPGSCNNGRECGHCHLCPEGEIKARKRRKQAMLRLGLSGATPKADASAAEPRRVSFAGAGGAPPAVAAAPATEQPRKVTFKTEIVTHTRSEGSGVAERNSRRARLAAFLEGREEEEAEEAEGGGGGDGGGATEPEASKWRPQAAPRAVCLAAALEPRAPEPRATTAPTAMPSGPAPSRGAALHGTAQCRPCAWYWRPGSCQNGVDCGHCHMCGEGELKARKKKKQVMLRLGLATPKPAPATESDLIAQAFSTAATCAGSGGKRGLPWDRTTSEQESTTASNSELDDDSQCAGSAEVPTGGPLTNEAKVARTAVGNFVNLPPGLRAPPGTPSHGSSLHKVGNCWPCANFWKAGGCALGEDCGYCHLCPQGEMKLRRRSKQAMMRLGLATPKVDEEQSYSFGFATPKVEEQSYSFFLDEGSFSGVPMRL